MSNKTTPRPWSYGIGDGCHNIYDANGALICTVFENLADRFRIVKAVNCHDDLVTALDALRAYCIPGMNWTDEVGQVLLDMADKAIAKAREGS